MLPVRRGALKRGITAVADGVRSQYLRPLLICLAALVLRLVHLATIQDSPFYSFLALDNLMYDQWGLRIASGELLGTRVFFQDPLYAYFLGLLYAVAGHRYVIVIAVQCLLGALVPALLFLAARLWFGRLAATVAAIIAALYLPAIYYEGMILKSWMALFLVALLLYLLSRTGGEHPLAIQLVAGLVFGLACLARGNLLLFLPVVLLWCWLGRGDRTGGRKHWSGALLFLAGAALVLTATAVRNRIVGGEWILTTSNAGQNFYIGNNPYNKAGEYQFLPFVDPNPKHEERGFALEAERRSGRKMSAREVSVFWFSEAGRWIKSDPTAWLGLMWAKLRVYWGSYEVPDSLDYYLYRKWAPVLRLPIPGFGLVAPLGLLGAALAWNKRGWPRLLLLFMVMYSSSVVLFFVFSRFRMAMMPAIYVFAGYGVAELVRRAKQAPIERAFPWPLLKAVALLLLFMCAVNLPVRAQADSWSLKLAEAFGLPTRAENSATAHYNLGLIYAAEARKREDGAAMLELAEEQLREASKLEPGHARILMELGKVLARLQRNAEAIEVYREALPRQPNDYRIHHALGLLYRRVGDDGAAARALRRAVELNPRDQSARSALRELERAATSGPPSSP
jgi:4-amino-4-deoxy-L-arabinose transferase-like glycosyltransferase